MDIDMRKKILALAFSIGLIFSMSAVVNAEEITGADNWKVVFTADEKMDSNFTTSSLTEALSGQQPGDTAVFTVALQNGHSSDTDWYMTNKVLYSLEDRSNNKNTGGGAYTYVLTYTDSKGEVSTLYDSDTVGGDTANSADRLGLREATDGLEDYFFLDTLSGGQSGYITLKVKLDGETQGNDYQDTLADLQMNFAVMLRGTNSGRGTGQDETVQINEVRQGETTTVVKTGDETNMVPFIIAAFVSGVVLLGLAVYSTKERKSQKGKGGSI
jgi:hypothetical protein